MFKKALVASAALMSAGVASAAVTGNFAITSDYIFRGVALGQAVQGGLDYSHDSGLYAGVWMSNSNAPANAGDEIDYYVGYGLGLSDGLSLDFGIINYNTDSTAGNNGGAGDTDTINELYVGIAGEAWDATLYYGDRDDGAANDQDNYMYIDLNYSMSTGETTSVDIHLGALIESDDANPQVNRDANDISVTYNVGDFGIGVSYLDIDEATPGSADAQGDERMNMFVSWGTEFDVK